MILPNFAEWVRITRGANTQSACAARARMTPQQWNQIEKQVKQPNVETVKRVAYGLSVAESEALRAAGYDTASDEMDMKLARRLEPILQMMPPNKREHALDTLEHVARTLAAAS